MTMKSYIRDQLLTVFPANQADMIANVVVEAHDALATRADMQEIREVVADLAHAQHETAATVRELAGSQQETAAQVKDLTTEVKELARAQQETAAQVKDLTRSQQETAAQVKDLTIEVKELARAQQETAAQVKYLSTAQQETAAQVKYLSIAQQETAIEVKDLTIEVKEMAVAVKSLLEFQRETGAQIREMTESQRGMLIRLDRADGRSLEWSLRSRLPAYVGRHVKRCRVLDVQELVESLEPLVASGALDDTDLDELRLADIVASGTMNGEPVFLACEASCTADAHDLERAVRRASVLTKAGKRAIPYVACESIRPETLEQADRMGVTILLSGRILSAAG